MPSRRSPSQRTAEGRQGRQMAALSTGTNAGRLISGARRSLSEVSRPSSSPTEVGTLESVNTVTASGSTQTLPDTSLATVHNVTLTANCTFIFPAVAAGKSFTLVLVQDGTGSRTAAWPASVRWAGGTAPALTTTAGKRDVFSFLCADGSTYLGFVAGKNYA